MLRTGDRILLAAFAAVFAGTVGGWVLLAMLPAVAAPRPAPGSGALAYPPGGVAPATPAAPLPTAAAPPRAAATGAAPEGSVPPATAQPEDAPVAAQEYRLQLDNGTLASFDPSSGRMLLRTPFGSLELRL